MSTQWEEKNCGEKVSTEEARQVMLEMLNTLVDLCENHGIRYYLDGGTLIGAVRHKGFIPWDEDIDVMMPQTDCFKLKQITGGRIGRFYLSDPRDMEFEFTECWRIYDDSYICREDVIGTYKPLFIDIEPMVGFPKGKLETRWVFYRLILLRALRNSAQGRIWHGVNFLTCFFHLLMRPIAIWIGSRRINARMQRIKDRLDFDQSEFVGNMGSAKHTWHGKVRREEYTRPNQCEFEGRMYSVPGNIVAYLEPLYGKNCTTELPPECSRHAVHDYQIYRYKGGTDNQ